MKFIASLVIVVSTLIAFSMGLAAQDFDDRGPLHETGAAREKLRQAIPDLQDRDLVLITMDSVLLERLPVFGKGEAPMPHLEALAKKAVVFENAYAVSPNRTSGLVGIHHSLYPSTAEGLGSTAKTSAVASRLADAGFSGYGIVRYGEFETDENIGEVMTTFDIDRRDFVGSRNPEIITERLKERFETRRSGERLFGWIHLEYTYPPATYYPGFSVARGGFENRYIAALQAADAVLGQVLADLEKVDALERSVIVVTGVTGLDAPKMSGREYRERGLNEASLHVPLLVQTKGLEPKRVRAAVETIDIAPTLLDLAGVEIDYSFQGRSFADLLVDPGARSGATDTTFAELLEWRGESRLSRRQGVRNERWIYSEDAAGGDVVLIDRQGDPTVNHNATKPEVCKELRERIEDLRVYTRTTADAWSRGIQTPLALDDPRGQLGRARYYAEKGRRADAEEILKRLTMREGPHLADTIAAAIETKVSARGKGAEQLLQHKAARIRGLAGAWLAMDGTSDAGLDAALASLENIEDEALVSAVLRGLGTSGLERARESIAAMNPDDQELAAQRDLALVRLGDAQALARLPQRFLTPRAGYDRLPFLAAIAEHLPEKLTGLCRIYLEDGDDNPRVVRAALHYLEAQNAREAAPSVARALRIPDQDLRLEIVNQLGRWQSFAAAQAAIEAGTESASDAAFAAHVLMYMPGLLSSSYVPSLDMRHFCSRFEDQGKRALEVGAKLTQSSFLEFTLSLDGLRSGRAVLLFRVDDPEVTTDDIRVTAQMNDSRDYFRTESLTQFGGVFSWVAPLRSESLEPGLNKFQLRVRGENGKDFQAHAIGFVVLPTKAPKRQMIAGLDVDSELRTTLRSGSKPMGDAETYHLFLRRSPFAEVGGEVRLIAGGRTFGRYALRDITTPRTITVALPDWATPDSLIELQAVDVPAGAGLTALLYGQASR